MNDINEAFLSVLDKLDERRSLLLQLSERTDLDAKAIADETMALHAPTAERLGLVQLKRDLEEFSVKYGYPEDYKNLKKLLRESEATAQLVFETLKAPICSLLDESGFEYRFEYRMKSVYSIWRKMTKKSHNFDDVYDLFASRVVFKPHEKITMPVPDEKALDPNFMNVEKHDCWKIYTIITSLYRLHPARTRDWITKPRPSGYEALQITVMGPDCNWVEIQIRSERMNDLAENGRAAHWKYKGVEGGDLDLEQWLVEIDKKL